MTGDDSIGDSRYRSDDRSVDKRAQRTPRWRSGLQHCRHRALASECAVASDELHLVRTLSDGQAEFRDVDGLVGDELGMSVDASASEVHTPCAEPAVAVEQDDRSIDGHHCSPTRAAN